ncbi:MAG: hypothetical protein HZB13_15375 [Acidobacteria bacterium]|nr:hypothetical protein [Acidobacteriota bacterium]
MVFGLDYRQAAGTVLGISASSAMFYFGNGLEPWWPLMWVAPAPVLLLALRSRWWLAAVAATATILLSSLNMWSYFTKTLAGPASAWVGIFSAAALVFAAGVLLFRGLVLRGAPWTGLLALPALWVTSEYARSVATPHGSAGSLAYSQLKCLPFLQLASITGPWGMSFVLLLFPAAIAIGLHLRRTSPKRALQVVGGGAGVIAAVLAFGAARLALPQTHMQVVKVGLIASDQKVNDTVADPGAGTERLFRDYAREAERLAAAGARVIVMPEKLGVILEGKAAGTDAVLQSVAARTGATMIAGVVHVDAPMKYNEARIYLPDSPVQHYYKQHMLPPFESSLKPGTVLAVLARPQQKWGVAICKDMDFATPARLYGKAGVGLMLVPAWDFVVDGSWHGHAAVMRGVEDGFSIARAARNGLLMVSDDRGRIIGDVSSSSAPFATLLVDVPVAHHWTAYQLFGDSFAWLAIALLVFAIMRLVWLGSPTPSAISTLR